MQNEHDMRRHIMSRVYWIFAMRQIAKPTVRAIVFLSACLAVTSVVSVQNVIANVMGISSATRLTEFFFSAFAQTEFFVQSALTLATMVALWSVVDFIRASVRAPAHA